LRIKPLYEKTKCLFGGILKSISLSLALNKFAIECCLENRRVMACELLMNEELRRIVAITDEEGDKGSRFSIGEAVSTIFELDTLLWDGRSSKSPQ
jgi:hypothetical protein